MTRWLVTLAGGAADLDWLVEWPDGDDWRIIRHENRGVALCGDRFEALSDHDSVRRLAEALIEHLNRAARHRLTDYQGVALGATVEQRQGGDHLALLGHDAVHVHVTAKATVAADVHENAVLTNAPTQSDVPQPGADCARLVALLEAHPDLADALRYLEEEPDMRGHYKVAEAIRDAVGGKWRTLVGFGWTTDADLRRFRQSTQPRRHHKGRAPDKPLTEAQADTYVRALLAKLIARLESTAS